MTKREKTMLSILASVNETVIMPFQNEQGIIVSYVVISGLPVRFETSPEHHNKPQVTKEYVTDADKLLFLRQFGQYMQDESLRGYGSSHYVPCPELRFRYTETERHLLARLDAGIFDGPIPHYWESPYGASFNWVIENGIPVEYKLPKATRFFDGNENETISKDAHIYRKCITDDDKLDFFQKFGRDLTDDEAFDYCWEYTHKRYQK